MIYDIEQDVVVYSQYHWFAPTKLLVWHQQGLSCINQSRRLSTAHLVNMRSSIIGVGGRAKEVQSYFLVFMEEAIEQPDIAKSIQRYELAVDQAKVRLNIAVSPGVWLMPARRIIYIDWGTTISSNRQLRERISALTNPGTKKAGLKLMEGRTSRIKRHPSNPIRKAATAANTSQKNWTHWTCCFRYNTHGYRQNTHCPQTRNKQNSCHCWYG